MLAVPIAPPELRPPTRLLDRVRWHLRVKRYSIRTETAYVDWVRRFILFHGKRHPADMGETEIAAFLSHLAVNRRVAAATQNQALSALLFLYGQVLDRKLEFIDGIERVGRPPKLPVVFTPREARAVLAHLQGDYRLMVHLLYGSGLRLLEALRLRVKDIDFGYRQITVCEGKGGRQRRTLLPHRLHRPSRPISPVSASCTTRTSARAAAPSSSPTPSNANPLEPLDPGRGSTSFPPPASPATRAPAKPAVITSGRKISRIEPAGSGARWTVERARGSP